MSAYYYIHNWNPLDITIHYICVCIIIIILGHYKFNKYTMSATDPFQHMFDRCQAVSSIIIFGRFPYYMTAKHTCVRWIYLEHNQSTSILHYKWHYFKYMCVLFNAAMNLPFTSRPNMPLSANPSLTMP